jgi:hypothetical protein
MRYFNSVLALGAVVGFVGIAPSVQAQTFASFDFSNNANAKALYTGVNGPTDTLGLGTLSGGVITPVATNSSLQATFRYLQPNGADGLSDILANMTFSATASGNVGGTATQTFSNVFIRFTNANQLVSNNGTVFAAGTANLLTVTIGSTGTMNGLTAGSETAGFSGSQGSGNVVGFSSDFLDFSGSVPNKTFTTFITNATNQSNNALGITKVNNPNADSFYGDFAGSFSADAVPGPLDPTPAPPGVVSALIGIAMGGAQFGMMKFRSRRRTKKAEVAESTEVAA